MAALIAYLAASLWALPVASAAIGVLATFACGGDWWLSLIVAAALFGAALAYRLLGAKGALAALGSGALAAVYRLGERRGAARHVAKEKADANRAVERAQRAGADADRRNADPGRLRDDDGFRRD